MRPGQEDDRVEAALAGCGEIRTLLCVPVIGNQALERKCRGGLGAFLEKHGGRYSDEITAHWCTAAEFDLDVADLIEAEAR